MNSVGSNLLSVPALAGAVNAKKLNEFTQYLEKNTGFLARHHDFDEFIGRYIQLESEEKERGAAPSKGELKQYRSAMTLLGKAANELRRVLWSHEVYLSSSVVEQLTFDLARDATTSHLAQDFFQFVVQRGLHQPGFVLYPIHGFGILGAGLFSLIGDKRPGVDLRDAGIMITSQTNSVTDTTAFLNEARNAFGISAAIPSTFDVEFQRGVTSWLTRNPLMAVRLTSVTSGYYQNQLIVVVRLRSAASIVLMLASLIREGDALNSHRNFSSAAVNNFQTLDIRHYVVFEGWTNELEVLRVPMNLDRTELTSLSDITVDIDPSAWGRPEQRIWLEKVQVAVHHVESGYIETWILGDRRSVRAKLLRKLYLSIGYFQRSFRGTLQDDEAAVALAIAFETLLTDGYGRGGPRKRISRRLKICLDGVEGATDLASSVDQLMERRGQVVHEGASSVPVSFELARKGYVHAFLKIAHNAHLLGDGVHNSIGDLLGDKPPEETVLEKLRSALKRRFGGRRNDR